MKTDFSEKLPAAGVNAIAYAAKLPSGKISVIILNKDGAADLEVELDFGRDTRGTVETETLHAPALDSREAHITTSTKTDSLKQGKISVAVPHASGVCDAELNPPQLSFRLFDPDEFLDNGNNRRGDRSPSQPPACGHT